MTEVWVRLRDAQVGPDASTADLLTHPQLKWYAAQCVCNAPNFRIHQAVCPVYLGYEMLERVINRLDISPELWVQRFGKRPR